MTPPRRNPNKRLQTLSLAVTVVLAVAHLLQEYSEHMNMQCVVHRDTFVDHNMFEHHDDYFERFLSFVMYFPMSIYIPLN